METDLGLFSIKFEAFGIINRNRESTKGANQNILVKNQRE